jgi:hypothetical protein
MKIRIPVPKSNSKNQLHFNIASFIRDFHFLVDLYKAIFPIDIDSVFQFGIGIEDEFFKIVLFCEIDTILH